MATAVRTPTRPRKTVAWTAAKLLILASFIGLAAGAYLSMQPVTNPGVQDCGKALTFFLENKENVVIHPGEPGAPPNAVALASQPSCRDLAGVELQKAAVGIAAFFVLGLLGIVIGLLDDRVEYWKAPNYESLLRPMPRDVRVEFGLEPKVAVEDLGVELPPLESPEVWGLALIGAFTFVVLPFVGPLDATRAAAGEATLLPMLLGALLAAATFLAAAVQRKAVYPDTDSWPVVFELVMATSWVGRLRPLVGSFGTDIHHLRKTGLSRDDAVLDVQVLQSVSLLVHVVLLTVAGALLFASPEVMAAVRFETPQWILLGAVGLMLASGLQRLPRRIRALPVRPGLVGIRGIPRVAGGADRVALLVGGTLFVTLGHVAVLVAALAVFGAGLPLVQVLFVVLAAVTLGELASTPNGVGVFEAVMALLLMRLGIEPGAAILATLVYRSLTFWLPMAPGWRAAARLKASAAL